MFVISKRTLRARERKKALDKVMAEYFAERARKPVTVAIVDWNDVSANLYACYPCPRCASTYRACYPSGFVECDNCGKREIAFAIERDED